MINELIKKYKIKFEESISNDLNINNSISTIFEFIKEVKKQDLKENDKKQIVDFLKEVDKVLGVNLFLEKEEIPKKIIDLANKRYDMRKQKNFVESDSIRDEIKKLGYVVLDDKENKFILKKI